MGLSKGNKSEAAHVSDMFGSEESNNEEIKFTISEAAFGHVMNSLSTLYSDPIVSMVRELCSNAIDANILATPEGASVPPISVNFPSANFPFFVVTDSGSGMDYLDLNNTYTGFGISTKREDVRTTGSYGYGAKSPMAITDSYEVITTKDGVTRECVVSRTDDVPKMTVKVKESGAESGTTVRVPIAESDFQKFHQVSTMYRDYSLNFPFILNGVLTSENDSEYILVDEMVLEDTSGVKGRIWIRKEGSHFIGFNRMTTSISVSLNNFLYDLNNGQHSVAYHSPQIIVELAHGVVDFTPPRDNFIINDRFKIFEKKVLKHIQSDAFFVKCYVQKYNNSDLNVIRDWRLSPIAIRDGKAVFNHFDADQNPYKVDLSEFNINEFGNLVDSIGFSTRVLGAYSVNRVGYANSSEYNVHMNYYSISDEPRIDFNVVSNMALTIGKLNDRVTVMSKHLMNSDFAGQSAGYVSLGLKTAKDKISYHQQNRNLALKNIFFIEIDKLSEINTVLRTRKKMERMFAGFTVIFVDAKTPISAKERNFIDSIFNNPEENNDVDEVETSDEKSKSVIYYQTVKEFESTVKTEKRKVSFTVQGFQLTEGYDSRSKLVQEDFYRVNNTNMVYDKFEDNDLLVIVNGRSRKDAFNAVNGYAHVHGSASIENRRIFVLSNPSITMIKSINNPDRIIAHTKAKANSKGLEDFLTDRRFYRERDQDVISFLTKEEKVGQYIRRAFVQNRTHVELANFLAKEHPSDFPSAVAYVNLMAKYPNQYGQRVTDEQVKEALNQEEWEEVRTAIAFSHVIAGAKDEVTMFSKFMQIYVKSQQIGNDTLQTEVKNHLLTVITDYEQELQELEVRNRSLWSISEGIERRTQYYFFK